jgi:hypothetical protein
MKLKSIEQRYTSITQWMEAAWRRQQSILGEGQASVAHGQIGIAIDQAAIEVNQIHMLVESTYRDFGIEISPLVRDAVDFRTTCRIFVDSDVANDGVELKERCSKLLDVEPRFREKADAMENAFKSSERVWDQERSMQRRILQAAGFSLR